MFKCDTCGSIFDKPRLLREYMGEARGAPAYEDFAVCPYCETGEFDEYDEDEELEDIYYEIA